MRVNLRVMFFQLIVFNIVIFFNTALFADSNSRIVTVGIFQNPPVVFQNDNGEPEGIYVDLLGEVASRENWKIVFLFDKWSSNLIKIKTGEIDLLSSIAFTRERAEYLDFSREVISTFWGVVYARKKLNIQSIIDLEGLNIAVMSRGIFGRSFRKLCNDFSVNCKFTETPSQDHSLKLLCSHNVDAAIFNNMFRFRNIPEEKIKKTPIIFSPMKAYIASGKGMNGDLLVKIDSYIKLWKEESNSIFYKSIAKWTGQKQIIKKLIPKWLKVYLPLSVFVIVFIFFWIITLKNQIIKRKGIEKELKIAIGDKDMLIKEIHHRVKNNLQIIQSLVSIQAMSAGDEARDSLDKVENRIKAISMIHERLYKSNELSRLEASDYIKSLIAQIDRSINTSPVRIGLRVDIPEIYLDVNIIIPCGLIINELVTNALKHAFPGDREGEINVRLTHQPENRFVLSIKDNGAGLSEGFSLEKPQSLGHKIVKSLAKQIRGDVQVISDGGTEFIIGFEA